MPDTHRSKDLLLGNFLSKPCCLVSGSTMDLGNPLPGETGVVLGCGQGASLVRLARAVGENGFVYGVEPSKRLLRQAEQRVSGAGLANVDLVHSIFESVELDDSLADWLISDCSILHASDKDRVWQEIIRLLKPGGRFVVSDVFADRPIAPDRTFRPVGPGCLTDLRTKEGYFALLDHPDLEEVTIVEESAPYPAVYRNREILLTSFLLSGNRVAAIEAEAEAGFNSDS